MDGTWFLLKLTVMFLVQWHTYCTFVTALFWPIIALFIIADPSGFILFPLVVHSFDLVVSSVGILSIRGTRDSGLISTIEDPMAIMQKGYSVTIMLAVLTFGAVSLVIFINAYVV